MRITVEDAARRLQVDPQSLREALKRGELQEIGRAYKLTRWNFLIYEERVENFLKGAC